MPLRRLHARIAATPAAAATARGLVRDACDRWGLPGLVEDAELVVTELVDNVVIHVGGTVDLRLTCRGGYLHVAVRDDDPTEPEPTLPDPDTGEGGRGLLLVDATAARWGSTVVDNGKIVWADLRIGPA
jgi:anti-sigma regulatory factor (Ser/Thr protein kinase)